MVLFVFFGGQGHFFLTRDLGPQPCDSNQAPPSAGPGSMVAVKQNKKNKTLRRPMTIGTGSHGLMTAEVFPQARARRQG